jgi:hypothetical protein
MAKKSIPAQTVVAVAEPNIPAFRHDSGTHFSRASSLANMLWGQGFENFSCCCDEIQQNVLFLLADEIDQGIAALAHEKAIEVRS